MSGAPSNEVLAEQIKNDREERQTFRAEIKDSLNRIEAQVSKTNGRVTKIEAWKMFVIGGFVALSAPYASRVAQIFAGQ